MVPGLRRDRRIHEIKDFWILLLFKHKEKSMKGCLVDALAIRGDEGRERLR